MGVVAEVSRLACCAWSPTGSHVVAGTYAGAVGTSFESSSTLELLRLDTANGRVVPTAPIPLPEKFSCITWSNAKRTNPGGIIVGGLNDGTVRVWDGAQLLRPVTDATARDANRGLLFSPATKAKHAGKVSSVSYNDVVGNTFATGGADGQVLLWDMTNPAAPAVRPPGGTEATVKDEILSVAWNPKIGHILATGSAAGVVSVWDVQNKKQVINIRNPRGRLRASSLVWHPTVATQLLVVCDEDDGTGAQLWDLRNATAPLATMAHHAPRGIMSASWCPHDPELVLTTSRDGRTMLVSPSSGSVIAELPRSTSAWNFDLQWSPKSAGVYMATSFDGRVSFNSVLTANAAPSVSAETANALAESFGADARDFQSGMAVQSPRAQTAERESVTMAVPPAWLKRPTSVCFGFGGRLVSVSAKSGTAVSISGPYDRDSSLGEGLEKIDALLASVSPDDPASLSEFCQKYAADAANGTERAAWEVLGMQFLTDSRRKMLKYLGFDAAAAMAGDMSDQVYGMQHSPALANPVRPIEPEMAHASVNDIDATLDAEGAPPTTGLAGLSLDAPAPWDAQDTGGSLLDSSPSNAQDGVDGHNQDMKVGFGAAVTGSSCGRVDFRTLDKPGLDALIRKSIVVGDFELAVDACFFAKRTADALVIAHAGGPALWHRAQADYLTSFSTHSSQGPIIGAATGAKNKMDDFIVSAAAGGGKSWEEALAVILTYVHGDEFVEACSALGQRLMEKENFSAALTCFLCACNTRMVATVWLRGRPASGNMAAAISSRSERLVTVVAKVRMVTAAASLIRGERDIGAVRAWDDVSASVLCEYGAMLAAQGDMKEAVSYLSALDPTATGVRGCVEDLQVQASESLAIQQMELGPSGNDQYGASADASGGGQYGAPAAASYAEPVSGYPNPNPYQSQDQYGYDQYGNRSPGMGSVPPMPAMANPVLSPGRDSQQGQWGGGYGVPSPPPMSMDVASGPRPGSVFSPTGQTPLQMSGTPQQGGAYNKTFYPDQQQPPQASSPPQNGYSVVQPQSAAPPMPAMPAMPAPPPPPPLGAGDGLNGFHQSGPATNGYGSTMPPPPPQPQAPMMVPPPMPVSPGAPGIMQPQQVGMAGMGGPGGGIPAYGGYGGHVASPPPPPPAPTAGDEPPMSYHANAQRGAGANLPASSEVAVAKLRSKPASASGVPGREPRRSPSTSSSLSSAANESALPLDKVDVQNIPGDQQVIVKSLRGAFQYALGRNGTMMYKKKMEDVSKKLGRLLARLSAKEMDPAIVSQLIVLGKAIEKGDYATAKQVTATFSKTVSWEDNRHWIQALNRLIDAVLNGR